MSRFLVIAVLFLGARAACAAAEERTDAEGLAYFERKVRPLLARRCFECHSSGAKSLKAGFRLDSREAALQGGETGQAIVPGDPDASRLIDAVRYGDALQMPPGGKLPAAEIELLTEWVRRGAPFPAESQPTSRSKTEIDWRAARQFWSFRLLRKTPPPAVSDSAWPRARIDCFVLAELEKNGLRPAGEADKRTFIRRASFDLVGLPPTPEEVAAFLADDSPAACERLIDRPQRSP